jgi:hypothetical protein
VFTTLNFPVILDEQFIRYKTSATKRRATLVIQKLEKLVSDAITVLSTANVDYLVKKPPIVSVCTRIKNRRCIKLNPVDGDELPYRQEE